MCFGRNLIFVFCKELFAVGHISRGTAQQKLFAETFRVKSARRQQVKFGFEILINRDRVVGLAFQVNLILREVFYCKSDHAHRVDVDTLVVAVVVAFVVCKQVVERRRKEVFAADNKRVVKIVRILLDADKTVHCGNYAHFVIKQQVHNNVANRDVAVSRCGCRFLEIHQNILIVSTDEVVDNVHKVQAGDVRFSGFNEVVERVIKFFITILCLITIVSLSFVSL